MKVSLNLAQYYSNVDLKKLPIEELLKRIGAQLGAVEDVTDWGARYEGITVVKVVECEKHPNADKLSVCLIDDGGVTKKVERNKDGFIEVVCGAPNVKAGLTVAWIPPGIVVPATIDKDPLTLEVREIRGKKSNGMLASAAELGISDNHDGILEITAEAVGDELTKPGTPFKQLFGLDDIVIDCENKMFTHRPDCFGNLGVARELAGIQGLKFESPGRYLNEPKFEKIKESLPLKVTVETDFVPRFMAVTLHDVTVGPSPMYMQAALTRVGIRPINNVVDITNFLMHLTGQPLHAYDYDKLKNRSTGGAMLSARMATDKEKVNLLNGKTIEARKEDILIVTNKEPVGLAGVMGGADTEVDMNTKSIALEVANFDMYSIRRTSMHHGLFTDAVTRFNKGQSPLQNDRVLSWAMDMLGHLAGAKQASNVYDVVPKKSVVKLMPSVKANAEFINVRLGTTLTAQQMKEILENVEFAVEVKRDELYVTPPFWRMDVELAEDIVEEIGRLYGFAYLPVALPKRQSKPSSRDTLLDLKQCIREALASAGANEVLTYSFVHGDLITKVGQDVKEAYRLRNAISPDLQYYRLTLTPSLLAQVHPNIKAGYEKFAIFEMNKTHVKMHGLNDEKVPDELDMVALVYTASDKTAGSGAAFYEARKLLDRLGRKLGLSFRYEPLEADPPYQVCKPFDWQRSAMVYEDTSGEFIGQIGEYTAAVRKNLKLPAHSAGFEIGLQALAKCPKIASYVAASRYPSTEQDITLAVDKDTDFLKVANSLKASLDTANRMHGYQSDWQALDIFIGEKSKKKHLTFRINLSHPDKTLKTEEVNSLLDEITKEAGKVCGAERV